MQEKIPKVIHYCWFGGNPLSELAQKCIASWKKYCPDYEIVEWNESNYDISACKYMSEAFEAKRWAFVSDYARFDILYKHGGLYFDTDVELIAPIDDIVEHGPFMGIEKRKKCFINPGLGLGAVAGMEIYRKILDLYNERSIYAPDGSFDLANVVTITTNIFNEYGFKDNTEKVQYTCGVYVYPWEYFCPKDPFTCDINITNNSRAIHHYDASWKSDTEKKVMSFAVKHKKFIPINIGKFIALIRYGGISMALKKFVDFFKSKYKTS